MVHIMSHISTAGSMTNDYACGCTTLTFFSDHPEWLPNLVNSIFENYSCKAKGIAYPIISSYWCDHMIVEKIWKINHNEEDKTNESLD